MPGPLPKDPTLRRRRNTTATRATLPASGGKRRRMPPLPADREWQPQTRDWWRDVWRSPMAVEFLQADVHGLFVLAALVDRFWTEPTAALAAEIRLQRQCFGLTPIDRRRLQWEVERVEAVTRKKPAAQPAPAPADDPRKLLSVVS